MKKTALIALLALLACNAGITGTAGIAAAAEGRSLSDLFYDDYGIEMLGFAETSRVPQRVSTKPKH
ncbi:MAG: hypothetical protein D3903_03965, partial [Candidatus Electrothrix sp. GM3_4]|nr:hypothetical protein [Candidatus Electrothrix sp. GM3_4]